MRPSDKERDLAIRHLQHGCAAGRLSSETFERRIELALLTKSADELHQLTVDIRRQPLLRRWLAWLNGPGWHPRRDEACLRLTEIGSVPFLVGRSTEADLVLTTETVSRRHLQIARSGGGFMMADLGSKNGTWLEHRRVSRVAVAAGDVLELGDGVRLRLL